MQLASVLLARYFGLIQIGELNLNGTLYLPELIKALVDRYGFVKFPTDFDSLDENKGIEFIGGRFKKRVIEKLVILDTGIYLDTAVNTAVSEELWFELMEWAVQTFGATFQPEMIKRHVYVSHLTFHADIPILAVNPILEKIGQVITSEVEKNYGRHLEYRPSVIGLHLDLESVKLGTAAFTIQRREGVPFSENKYYSSAPLKTDLHLELLNIWELAMSG
ncbi:MAG: hypothetical protein WBE38_08715 [Terracidiphilus sp.]